MSGTHVKLVSLLRELIQFASAIKYGAKRQRVAFDREYGGATARHFSSRVSGDTVSRSAGSLAVIYTLYVYVWRGIPFITTIIQT